MRHISFVFFIFHSFVLSTLLATPFPTDTGVCKILEAESICRDIGANLNIVFLPIVPGKTSQEVESEIEAQVSTFIDFFSSLPLRSSCLSPLLELLCRSAFPDCEQIDGLDSGFTTVPLLLDRVACTQVTTNCAEPFAALEEQNINLFTCTDIFPNTEVPGYSDYFYYQLEGKPVFPVDTIDYFYNFSTGSLPEEITLTATLDTVLPQKFNFTTQCASLDCGNAFYRNIDCNCVFSPSCPFPAYPETVFEISWILVVILGFLSLPFNLAILLHAGKFRQVPFIPIAGAIGLLYVLSDTLFVLIFKYNFSCVAEGAASLISSLSFEDFEEEWYCTINKGSVHLLQMLLNASVVGISNIYTAVKAAKDGIRLAGEQSRLITAAILVYIFVIPIVCLAVTFALGSDSTSFKAANELRYAFSCGPRFQEIWQEALFVHIPIIISGILLFIYCARVAYIAYEINGFGSQSRKYSRKEGAVAVDKEKRRRARKQKLTTAQKIARRVTIFGTMAAVFSVLYSICTLSILLVLQDFDKELEDFVVCNVGIDFAACQGGDIIDILNSTCEAEKSLCGDNPGVNVPSSVLFALNWIIPSVIPLLFGIIFGVSHLRQDIRNFYVFLKTCGYEEEVFRTFVADDRIFFQQPDSFHYSKEFSKSSIPGLNDSMSSMRQSSSTPGMSQGSGYVSPPPGLPPPGMDESTFQPVQKDGEFNEDSPF